MRNKQDVRNLIKKKKQGGLSECEPSRENKEQPTATALEGPVDEIIEARGQRAVDVVPQVGPHRKSRRMLRTINLTDGNSVRRAVGPRRR